jgi:phospholipase C
MAQSNHIEHIVVLMLENRSFDNMLGRLPGVNGVLGKDGKPNPAFFNNAPPGKAPSLKYPAGEPAITAIPAQDIKNGFGGPGHSFADATMQLDASAQTAAAVPATAPLDGFVASYLRELSSAGRTHPTDSEVREPMTTFTAAQVPVITQLAGEFCVCDQWYSEVPGPTEPNRLFAHSATSTGLVHNVWNLPINAPTIYEELDKAGHDWAFFFFDLSDSNSFPALKKRTNRILKFTAFYSQAKAGTLPTYSFLCPQYADGKDGSHANSQHAPYDIRYGELLIADVYEALRSSPLWNQTLLIITYDEHGGYFDHVSPPAAVSPDGLSSPTSYDKQQAAKDPKQNGYLIKPNMTFGFNRLGLRVPCVLVSPWIRKGTVDSTPYQHTSIFATLRDLFGVGTLTKRDAGARSFFAQLRQLSKPRTDAPMKLTRPVVTAAAADLKQPLTDRQKELWPILSQLDGHKDSGVVTRPPNTRAAAADYIQERIAAHNRFHRERRRKAAYKIVYQAGSYSWRLHDEKGETLATSSKTYATSEEATADIQRMRDLAPAARQVSAAKDSGLKKARAKGAGR